MRMLTEAPGQWQWPKSELSHRTLRRHIPKKKNKPVAGFQYYEETENIMNLKITCK